MQKLKKKLDFIINFTLDGNLDDLNESVSESILIIDVNDYQSNPVVRIIRLLLDELTRILNSVSFEGLTDTLVLQIVKEQKCLKSYTVKL